MRIRFRDSSEIPVDHLYASTIFIDYIQSLDLENLTIASPDMGGAKRAKNYAGHLGAEVVIAYKERKKGKCSRRNVPYW